jgi:hypothetical protein
MKHAVEMTSGGMICIRSSIKTHTDVQNLLGMGVDTHTDRRTHTHTHGQQGDLIRLL